MYFLKKIKDKIIKEKQIKHFDILIQIGTQQLIEF